MLGGFLWCTGNLMAVAVIQCIGMGMGLLVWGASNLLTGWATGHFGLFGLNIEEVANDTLNIIGVCLALLSMCTMFFVRPDTGDSSEHEATREITSTEGLLQSSSDKEFEVDNTSFVDHLDPVKKKNLGFAMAVVAGVFFGAQFTVRTACTCLLGQPLLAMTSTICYLFAVSFRAVLFSSLLAYG